MKEVLQPDHVKWMKGTSEEYDDLCDSMVSNGSFIRFVVLL
jgi:GTP-dependent phosphoenolpyruvate carboxykinase